MKVLKCKNRFLSFFLAVAIIVSNFSGLSITSFAMGNEKVNLMFESSYNQENNTEIIKATAVSMQSNLTVTGIRLPDGTLVQGSEIQYAADKNGNYDFEVHYQETTIIEENVAEVQKEGESGEDSAGEMSALPLMQTKEVVTEHTQVFSFNAAKVQELTASDHLNSSDNLSNDNEPENTEDPAVMADSTGLIQLKSNKTNGWKWWKDAPADVSAGNTHLQYVLTVKPNPGGPEKRIVTVTLGNEDNGVFLMGNIPEAPQVIESHTISDDKRTLELVLNNQAINNDWSLDILVLPEGKDPRTSYIEGVNPTYGAYIGEKFYDNVNFGASASATEDGYTATVTIDFAWDTLYAEIGGANAPWLYAAGEYTDAADSPKNLQSLEMMPGEWARGAAGYQGQDAGSIQVMSTTDMHMPAGDVKGLFQMPDIYLFGDGSSYLPTWPQDALDASVGFGVLGKELTWSTGITKNPYGMNGPSSEKTISPGTYSADKNAIVEWQQLEYNPNTKTLSKVKKTIDYGKIVVEVPKFKMVNNVKIDSKDNTVDGTTTKVSLKYATELGAESYDFGNGTLTFDIPKDFILTGIDKPGEYTEIELTYDDGSQKIVATTDLDKNGPNLPIPNGKKITKVVCKLTENGLMGPYTGHDWRNLKQDLYGSFTDPDPTTDARDEPDKNRISIGAAFDAVDGSFTTSGSINSLYYDEGNPIQEPYISVEPFNYAIFDSARKTEGSKVIVGIDTLYDVGSDGLTTTSPKYKNLEIKLEPGAGSEAGPNQWKTLFGYTFNQINGNIQGTKKLEFHGDAWIEYTLTGETVPRRIYIYKDGNLLESWNWSVVFPGYDAVNGVYLTSLKLHFNEISVPSKTEQTALRELVSFTHNQDRRWASTNPNYTGKEEVAASWKTTLTYQSRANETTAESSYKYKLYAKSPIHLPYGNSAVPGIQAPPDAVRGSYIPSDISVVLPFSVNIDYYQDGSKNAAYYLDDQPYAAALPSGSKVYLKLNSIYFSYYGPTKDTDPNSRIEVIKDSNGDTWIAYDKSGDIPAVNRGSNDFTAVIPANSILVNSSAKSGQTYQIFTEAYMDIEPLEQMERDANIGKIDYYYKKGPAGDSDVITNLVTDQWSLTNSTSPSKGLLSIPVASTQITAASQEQLFVLPGMEDHSSAGGVQWTADKNSKLQATIQIGSDKKDYYDYNLLIPLPQKGKPTTHGTNVTANNEYTMQVDKVTIPQSLTAKPGNVLVTYYDSEDGTGTGSTTIGTGTKSIRIAIANYTGNADIKLDLSVKSDSVYDLSDGASAYIAATAAYNYYDIKDDGSIDQTQKSDQISSINIANYHFAWYTIHGRIFIESESENPNGKYDLIDTLYNKDSFDFKDLKTGNVYTASVNSSTGIYTLPIQPSTKEYELAPVVTGDNYVLTEYTNATEPDETKNTNFPRDYQNAGAVFTANAAGLSSTGYIKDFSNVNLGLYVQGVERLGYYKTRVGEEITFNVVPTHGGEFVSIEDTDNKTAYGTFSAETVQGDSSNVIGKITLKGTAESLAADGKTLEDKRFTVTMKNFFGETYVRTAAYQIYKDPFVTFNRGDGTWGDQSSATEKEVLLEVQADGDTSGSMKEADVPVIEKANHDFTGWTITREGNIVQTGVLTFDGIVLEKYDVLTPGFALKNYTVTFVDHDDTVLGTETVTHGSGVQPPASPSRTGYTFDGWDQATDNVISDMTVKATYKVNQYQVRFVDYDDTDILNERLDFGTPITAPADPAREGYTFTGWDTSVAATVPAADVVYKATYSINQYKVKFIDYNNRVIAEDSLDFGTAITVPADPEREGHTFAGWKPQVDATVPAKDVTYKATYTINSYTVTFVDHDKTVLATERVPYGKGATAPKEPTRKGYIFSGWDKKFDYITEDLTIQAIWVVENVPPVIPPVIPPVTPPVTPSVTPPVTPPVTTPATQAPPKVSVVVKQAGTNKHTGSEALKDESNHITQKPQPKVDVNEEKEEENKVQSPALENVSVERCVIHWFLIVLVIFMFMITMIKRRSNKKEIEKLRA